MFRFFKHLVLSKKQIALLSIGTSLTFWDIFNVPYIENYASKQIGEISSTLILSAEMLGYFLGGVINGYLASKYGRKFGLLSSMALISIGSLLGFISLNLAMLLVAELLIGIGIEGEVVIVPSYISEMSRADSRGKNVGYTTMSGFLMSLVVTPVAILLGEDFWRLLFLPSLLLAVIALLFRIKLPESTLWENKRYESLRWDKDIVIFTLIWFTSYFTGYALFSTPIFSLIASQGYTPSNLYFGYILYGDPLGVVIASVLNDRLQRKYTSSLANLLSAILMIIWPFSGIMFLPIGFAIMFFQGFKFPPMYTYTAESLGTKIRTLGYGIADGIGHLGGAVGPIVFVLLQDHIGLAFSTGVVGMVSAISAILIMVFGQITNKIPLEKIKG